MAQKEVPQSAPLSAGGGSNSYLGNAQMQSTSTNMGLPLCSELNLFQNDIFNPKPNYQQIMDWDGMW